MGKIMKDGIQYGVGGIQKAEGITYDNTDSGMTATNVQSAVDELSNGLTTLESSVSGFNDRLAKYYYRDAGTYTIALKQGAVYLFVVEKLNTSSSGYAGLYVATAHNASNIYTIKAADGITLSISGLVLTVTTTTTYMTLSTVRWSY